MASGSADEKTLSNTPSWRIELLILVFIVITLLWEKGTDKIEHFLSSRKRLGLRHVIHKVEEELLALGLISLLLIALQDPLSNFCIDKPEEEYSSHESKYSPDPYSKEEPAAPDDSHARRLTASGGGAGNCPEGKEPFWSIATTHQTHIFIFLLALIHIVYAMLSMIICLWKVRRWKKWEDMADHNLSDMNILSRRNMFCYYWDAWTGSFTESIDRSVYLGLRRLFIERMSLTDSFNFHEFLVNSMEEEFSKVVKMEWLMWAIVGIWVLAPPYVLFIMTGFAVIIMVVVGTQLELVAIKLSHQAYLSYGDRPTLTKHEGPSLIRRSLATISKGLRKGSKKHHTDGEVRHEVKAVSRAPSSSRIHSDDLDLFMARDKRRASNMTRTGSFSLDHSRREKEFSTQEITSSGAPSAIAPERISTLERGSHVHSGYTSSSDDEYQTDTPLHPGMMRHAEASIQESQDGKPGTSFGNVDYGEKLGGLPVMESHEQEKASIGSSARRWARAVDWAIGGKKREEERMQRQQDTFAESYPVADSAQLFWLRRPRLMLRAVQFTYFETSIVLAILLFNMWQDMAFIISKDFGNHNWLTFGLVILGVLLMLHSAYFILPVYALTMAAGSHCPRSILKLAKKKKIKPQMVNALERMSYNPFGQGTTSAEATGPDDVMIDMDWEREIEKVAAQDAQERNQNSITTLLGAMFQEKAKEFALARRSYQKQSEDLSLQPRWMSEASPRAHGKSPMSFTEPELLSNEHVRPASPLRTSSQPPEDFKRMPTFAIMGNDEQSGSGSRSVEGGGTMGTSKNPHQYSEHEAAEEDPRGGLLVDLGGQLRKSSFSFDSQMSGVAGARRMPSQTILDEPDAYTKKCTIYGSHATLHEIALLFKKAEDPRGPSGSGKAEHGRRRGSS
ncbi:hypothetical protein BSKO_11073 [Bryopsis sp. KO-2023]|nr:hypothetical protein BSKO_11073 [Bryopsis sp. KO-2023]